MSSFTFFGKTLIDRATGSIFAVLLLVLVTLGCGSLSDLGSNTANNETNSPNTSSQTANSNAESNTETANNTITGDRSSPCFNEYYPVQKDITRNYKVTGSSPGSYTLIHTLVDSNDSFIETRDINGLIVKNNWVCTAEGLRNAEYNNTATMQNAQFNMETLKSSGVTFPKVWEENKEWNTNYEVKVDFAAGPIKTVANGTVDVKNKISSLNDKVKVEGGEFTAARIDSEIKISLTVKGTKAPGAVVKMSNWYAPGIGMVKQEVDSNLGGQKVEYTGSK